MKSRCVLLRFVTNNTFAGGCYTLVVLVNRKAATLLSYWFPLCYLSARARRVCVQRRELARSSLTLSAAEACQLLEAACLTRGESSASTVPPQQLTFVFSVTRSLACRNCLHCIGHFSSPDVRQCWSGGLPALAAPASLSHSVGTECLQYVATALRPRVTLSRGERGDGGVERDSERESEPSEPATARTKHLYQRLEEAGMEQ
jgi:hypothetical protein